MSKTISQSETTASRYDAGASSTEWRPLKAINANVQMRNSNDEAMFDEATMVDDDEEEDIQKSIGDPMAQLQLRNKRNYCKVCCEEVEDHKSYNCPYFVLVPKGARVGEHCDIVCTECGELVFEHEGELNVDYEGRAILKYYDWCEDYCNHGTEECKSMPK